ncbi:MAG: BatD family protein [Melioribacteraceae bacterium]|nr:BatD family protein [Melioribacteraceae bacterium]
MKNIKLYSAFVLFFLPMILNAQSFKATVDRTSIPQNVQFQVYFTLDGEDVNKVRNFSPPNFSGFRILSGPNQSSNMTFINGKVSASLTYSYILVGTDIGDFTIGTASVEYDGKRYQTEPIKLSVVKGNPTAQNNQQSDVNVSEEELSKNVFIRAFADKRSVFQGEQVTVEYKLYTKLNISSPQISKLPSYNGFWSEELEPIRNINFNVEMFEGERYRVATLKRVALFPTKSGELEVTPFELTIPVLIRRKTNQRSLFDEFFNDSFFSRTETIEYQAKSNKLKINSKPLPTNDVPESFEGAVGEFDFKAVVNETNVKMNDPVNLNIQITGTGNIKLLNVPKFNIPAGFEQYDPKTNETITNRNIISGTKIFEYLLVPRVSGERKIGPIEFSYFSPSKGRYITQSSPEFVINIERVEGFTETAVNGFSKEDVRLLNEDIRFIKTSQFELERIEDYKILGNWFWIALVFPAAFLIVIIAVRNKQEKLSANIDLLKYQKAEKEARKKLKEAKKALEKSDTLKFYNEVSKALYGYLQDKLSISQSEFTIESAVSKLNSKNVNEELVNSVKEISDKCEFARFAPKKDTSEELNTFYERVVKTIVKVEDSIK